MQLPPPIKQLLNTVFPCICHGCAGTCSALLCDACLRTLPHNTQPRCGDCDLPLPHAAPLCANCLKHPPSYDRCISPWRYEAPLDQWLVDFKDHQNDYWLPTFANALIERLHESPHTPAIDLLIPVPIHRWRKWRRGYNQSELMARYLSHRLKIPWQHALKKTRQSHSQKQLTRRERLRNLKNSFAVTQPVSGLNIALIDDVMTTGATAETISKLLKSSGAKSVEVWVLARTPLR